MTTIHDLRNGNIPQSRYQHGDIVIYYDGPFTVNIGQVRGDGNRPQLHFIAQVDDKTAQGIIDTGDWCEDCEACGRHSLATTTTERGVNLCDVCEQARQDLMPDRNRQEHEDAAWLAYNDYRETLADFAAMTGQY
jgi:hypothetical protein